MDPFKDEFLLATEIVISAGQYVRSAAKSQSQASESKECYADLVTEYDQKVEKMLMSAISEKFADHKFIAEEMSADGNSAAFTDEPTWIIDPIDGTTNFVHGFPAFAISVGFFHLQEPVFGIVYDIPNDKMYSAVKGKGAFCNGRLMKCSPTTELQEALIATEYGSQREPNFLKFKIDTMAKIVEKCHGIRSLGCATLNIIQVAMGTADAYYEFGPHIWDFAAAHLIALEAGAVCSAPNGSKMDLCSRKLMVCSTKELRDQLTPLIDDYQLARDC